MKKVIYNKEKQKVPIKIWTDYVEDGAMEQAINLSNHPGVFKHVALMPDVHHGYGMPIGGVMATYGMVVPNAVGVDIGCGMCSIETTIQADEISRETYKKILEVIQKNIPVGFKHHEKPQSQANMPNVKILDNKLSSNALRICISEFESALHQLGTLGGGNHFIELQKNKAGKLFIMIHSGSRNLGYKVAKHYNNIAKYLNAIWHSNIDPKHNLAFLPIDSTVCSDYLLEMQYCVDFALKNRQVMMYRIMDAISNCAMKYDAVNVGYNPMINISHNYVSLENHFRKNVYVHRKGATSAKKGQIGIIPGSQGSKSYIVEGKGNKESFMSCSHGAGRKMGRKKAQSILNLEKEKAHMDKMSIIHNMTSSDKLDEAPGAYKDIDEVINNELDLVAVLEELTPIAVIKG